MVEVITTITLETITTTITADHVAHTTRTDNHVVQSASLPAHVVDPQRMY